MMEKTYQDLQSTRPVPGGVLDEYQRKLAALKERIRCGRNWKILRDRFGPSILLLIPSKANSVCLRLNVEHDSLNLFESILKDNERPGFNSKHNHRCDKRRQEILEREPLGVSCYFW